MEELEDAINDTKAVLQPLFPKPKLSSKLLSKPPFRFIHDIVMATFASTGFPDGLFDSHELDSSSYKDDKSAKLSFLDKLIHLVSVGSGSNLEASSSKIVAGLEPLNTNVLLVAFGRLAVDKKLDRTGLIRHCLYGRSVEEYKDHRWSARMSTNTSPAALESDANDFKPGLDNETRADLPNDNDQFLKMIQACNEDIEQTREMVSRIVAKPKCSDKLLCKPPFRFLHDLVTTIGTATDFDFAQVFSNEEMDSANIKEKEDKICFLEKLIHFLEGKVGTSLDVRPNKIVSGLEPERTRYLLQIYTVVATTEELSPVDIDIVADKQTTDKFMPAPTDIQSVDDGFAQMDLESHLAGRPSSVVGNGDHSASRPSTPNDSAIGNAEGPLLSMNETVESEFVADQTDQAHMTIDSDEEDEELPEFGSWERNDVEIKEMEEIAPIGTDMQLRLHLTSNHRPSTAFIPPAKLSETDIESIAKAVGGIAQLTASIGQFLEGASPS